MPGSTLAAYQEVLAAERRSWERDLHWGGRDSIYQAPCFPDGEMRRPEAAYETGKSSKGDITSHRAQPEPRHTHTEADSLTLPLQPCNATDFR